MKFDIKKTWNVTEKFLKKYAPEIFTGLGIVSFVGGGVLAVKATVKAVEIVNDDRIAETDSQGNFLDYRYPPKKQIVASCWKLYVPAVIATAAGTAFVVSSTHLSATRLAAAVALASANEKKLTEYKEAAQKVLSDHGIESKEVREQTAKDKVAAAGPVLSGAGQYPGKGPQLCQDGFTNQRFWSSRQMIENARNEINYRLNQGNRQTVNDLFYELDIPECDAGKYMGWDLDMNGQARKQLEIDLDYVMDEVTGEPILVMSYEPDEMMPF